MKIHIWIKKIVAVLTAIALVTGMLPAKSFIEYFGESSSVSAMGNTAGKISSGYAHSLAVNTDGSLWAWGYNLFGQLGDGTNVDSYIPKKIMDDVSSVSAGMFHSLAIKKDGSLWSWGTDSRGALGDEEVYINRYEPKKIMDDVSTVSSGMFHNLAIKKDASLWSWGINDHGELGDPSRMDCEVPRKVMDGVITVAQVKITVLP